MEVCAQGGLKCPTMYGWFALRDFKFIVWGTMCCSLLEWRPHIGGRFTQILGFRFDI